MKLDTMKASKIIPIGHLMIRVEAEDYDAWLKTHYDHVEDRHSYGMTDGPVYRDIGPGTTGLPFVLRFPKPDRLS